MLVAAAGPGGSLPEGALVHVSLRRRCSPSRLIGLLPPVVIAVGLGGVEGCGAGGRTGEVAPPPIDPALSARENLSLLADREQPAARAARDVPLAPTLNPDLFAMRAASDPRAFLSFAEVLSRFAAEPEISQSSERDDVEPEVTSSEHAEALRLFVRGRLAAENEANDEALELLQQAADIEPSMPAIHRAIAHAARRMNRPEAAMAAYERLAAIDERDAEALFMFAVARADQGRFEEAIALLARATAALREAPADPALVPLVDFVLSRCLREAGYDRASTQAAAGALELPQSLAANSMFAGQLAAMWQQRFELLRAKGDTHCRLGDYADARSAYLAAAELVSPAHPQISGRLIYINARLGLVFAAQSVMRRILDERGEALDVAETLFADYVAEHCRPIDVLRDSVLPELPEHRHDVRWVRIAATLSEPLQRDALIREFLREHPDELAGAFEIIRWRWGAEPLEALRLVHEAVAARPEEAANYARWCVATLPRSTRAIALIDRLPDDPPRAALAAHLHLALDDPGGAWRVVSDASGRLPGSVELRRLRLDVADAAEEVPLVLESIDSLDQSPALADQLRICRSLRSIGRTSQALDRARRLESLDDGSNDWLVETARCLIARTTTTLDREEAVALGREAAGLLERAIERDATDERIYEVQMSLFGAGGLLHSPDDYRNTFERFVQANPDSLALTHFILRETIRQNQLDRTVRVAQRLFNADPTDRVSAEAMIEAWWRLQQPQAASQWLDLWLADFPSHPALIEQRVKLHLLQDDAAGAEAFIERALDAEPAHPAALRSLERVRLAQGRLDEVVALAKSRMTRRPPGVRRALELATVALEARRPRITVEQLHVIAANADDAKMEYLTTALVLAFQLDKSETDRLPLVEQLAMATIERFPFATVQVYGLGLFALHERVGLSAEFTDLADRTVQRDLREHHQPLEQATSWRQIAQVFVDAGHVEAVSGLLRIRLRFVQPDERELQSALCMLIFALDAALGRADASLDLLRELDRLGALPRWPGMDREPTLDDLLYEVSLINSTLDNQAGVDLLLSQLLSRDPSNAMALNNLGYILLESGDTSQRAIEYIERAAAIRPDDVSIIDSLAWLRYKQGRLADDDEGEGAFSLVQHAMESATTPQPEVIDHLGDIAWRLGRRDDALGAWRQVVDLLSSDEYRAAVTRSFRALQASAWGVLVIDPQAIYDRDFGVVLDRARAKLAAVEAGEPPPVAPIFAELRREE